MPSCEELTAWFERVPFTWLPSLLSEAATRSVINGFFSPDEITAFVKDVAEKAATKNPADSSNAIDKAPILARLPY